MTAALLVQAATATVVQSAMPTFMQIVGIVTGILTLIMLVIAAVIYAYKLGIMKRDTEAVRADAVRATDSLTGEVHNGFKTVHRRMDKFDAFVGDSETQRRDWTGWRSQVDGKLERVEVDVNEIKRVREDDRRVGPPERRHD